MPAARKYPVELRRRAVEMVLAIREWEGKGHGEIAWVGRQLGIHPESLRVWIREREISERQRREGTATDSRRLAELERQVAELLRTIQALSAAILGEWSLPEMRSGLPDIPSD